MRTPLFDALLAHQEKQALSYHTPGHKNGVLAPSRLLAHWGSAVFADDLTEITGFDNLANPQGILAESMEEAALSLGSKHLRYLTAGSSLGLQVAILANCRRQKVFVPRHAHRSIYHALYLADAQVISLEVTCDPVLGIPLGLHPDTLAQGAKDHPDCKHLILVHPTYHGFTWQNKELVALAKSLGITSIADSAHGAHFFYHEGLPEDALNIGCDIVISGAHKTLPVLTQTSLLLWQDDAFTEAIDQALRHIQTTSPSYLFLTSLELGLADMAEQGHARIDQGLKAIKEGKEALNHQNDLVLFEKSDYASDPFKWYLQTPYLHPDHYAQSLENQGIYPEMTDHAGTLLLLPLSGPHPHSLKTLQDSAQQHQGQLQTIEKAAYQPQPLERKVSLRQAWDAPSQTLPLEEACGAIAGDILDCYPPGIPLLLPGEEITQALITCWKAAGKNPHIPVRICLEPLL